MENTPPKLDALHLGVLIRMLHSPEAQERDVAVRALKEVRPESVTPHLRDPKLTPEAMEYFARHAGDRGDWIEALLSNPSLPEEDRALLAGARTALAENEEEQPVEEEGLNIAQRKLLLEQWRKKLEAQAEAGHTNAL